MDFEYPEEGKMLPHSDKGTAAVAASKAKKPKLGPTAPGSPELCFEALNKHIMSGWLSPFLHMDSLLPGNPKP